jgi:hypothetical protein
LTVALQTNEAGAREISQQILIKIIKYCWLVYANLYKNTIVE